LICAPMLSLCTLPPLVRAAMLSVHVLRLSALAVMLLSRAQRSLGRSVLL
jgi:hypothetical protein